MKACNAEGKRSAACDVPPSLHDTQKRAATCFRYRLPINKIKRP